MTYFLMFIIILLIIIQWLYEPKLDINKETGDLLLWFNYHKRRTSIILINNFKNVNDV